MNIKYVTLLTALFLATVAGLFSIFGMIALFAGNIYVGIAAGVAAELGKLTGISFLYRYWKDGIWFRYPAAIITLVAMFVTSLGVFGMLSKAHTDQGAPVANQEARINIIDSKILREQNKISAFEATLAQLDAELAVLIKFNKITVKGGANEVRAKQEPMRDDTELRLEESLNKLDTLQEEKFTKSQTVRDYKAEVGPVSHLAKLLFNSTDLEKAITVAIISIMLVLDPMAIMLLMGYNHIVMREKELGKETKKDNVLPPKLIDLAEAKIVVPVDIKRSTDDMSQTTETVHVTELQSEAQVHQEQAEEGLLLDEEAEKASEKEWYNAAILFGTLAKSPVVPTRYETGKRTVQSERLDGSSETKTEQHTPQDESSKEEEAKVEVKKKKSFLFDGGR